ncbi:MAG TPA: CBS domain-containing protein [Myxococcota bacterium]|nr:CBS domain-containing protein [Myxococcota bacterium]
MHAIRHIIRPYRLVTAPPTATVMQIAQIMARARVGAIPIVEDDRIVGIFSERDLMTRVVVEGRDPSSTCVCDAMTTEVMTAAPHDTRSECLEKMQRAGFRHLPVLEEGRLMAMLSMRDLLRDEIAEQDEEIRGLRAYLHQTPI